MCFFMLTVFPFLFTRLPESDWTARKALNGTEVANAQTDDREPLRERSVEGPNPWRTLKCGARLRASQKEVNNIFCDFGKIEKEEREILINRVLRFENVADRKTQLQK